MENSWFGPGRVGHFRRGNESRRARRRTLIYACAALFGIVFMLGEAMEMAMGQTLLGAAGVVAAGGLLLVMLVREVLQVDRQLQAAEEQVGLLQQVSVDGLCIVQDRMVVECNERAAALFGYEAATELVGTSVSMHLRRQGLTWQGVRRDGIVFPASVEWKKTTHAGQEAELLAIRDETERHGVMEAMRESERRYRSVVRNAREGIFTLDVDGHFLEANPAMVRLLGLSDERTVCATRMSDWVRDVEGWEALMRRVAEEEVLDRVELQLDNGETTIHVRGHLRLMRDLGSGDRVISGIWSDVTVEKEASLQQAALRAFYEGVLNEIPIDIRVFDPEGCYLFANPTALPDPEQRDRCIGLRTAELAGADGQEQMEWLDRWIESVLKAKETRRIEERVRVDGELRHMLRVGTPLLDADGAVRQLVLYGIDMTERRRFEEELIDARDRAEEMNRLKDAFLANMSHEIRTPMTTILGFIDLLAENADAGQMEFVGYIGDAARRLQSTLTSILEFARLEAGEYGLNETIFPAEKIVAQIADRFAPMAQDKGLELEVDLPGRPTLVRSDRSILERILQHLVENALKFTDRGTVLLGLELTERGWSLQVRDTGIGMSEQFQERVFEPFQQESEGTSRAFEGNGLGLAITRHFADLLGGRLEIDSEQGEGTSVQILLPHETIVSSNPARRRQAQISTPQ